MAIIQGVTPTFTLTVPETVDLTEAVNVYATFSQGHQDITKTGNEITVRAHEVDVYLSQEDTLSFVKGSVMVEMNWTYADGSRGATYKVCIEWDDNLLKKVLQ